MATGQNISVLNNLTTNFIKDITESEFFSHPFEIPSVQVVIIVSFVSVFLLCLLGNAIVLYVLTRSTQITSRTNLFLANLAIADLCVGVICVLPNMLRLLTNQWYLGQAFCKISKFVEYTNISASVLLQEVIAVERYIAINYPLKSRHLFSQYKLYVAQFIVWLVSCAYNIPYLFIWNTMEYTVNNVTKTTCMYSRAYNDFFFIYHFCNFVFWYVIPLLVMCIMYCQISRTLWKSNVPTTMMKLRKRLSSAASSNMSEDNGEVTALSSTSRQLSDSTVQSDGTLQDEVEPNQEKECEANFQKRKSSKVDVTNQTVMWHKRNDFRALPQKQSLSGSAVSHKKNLGAQHYSSSDSDSEVNLNTNENNKVSHLSHTNGIVQTKPKLPDSFTSYIDSGVRKQISGIASHYRVTSQRASSRRRVIRLLLAILFVFAILVLPNHLRLIIFSLQKTAHSEALVVIPPICQFLLYLNSAMNPILYSLLSQSFRRCIKETLARCLYKK